MKFTKIGRAFSGILKLWKERHRFLEKSLPTDLKSFLPPSLEVMEKPPHPAPRVILAIIGAICLVGLIWAIFGRVDVITVAEGKIIPSGKIKQIQPFDRGVVRRILINEGQLVEAGAPLMELDQTQTQAEELRLNAESKFVREKRGRRKIMVELLRDPNRAAPADEKIINHPGIGGDRKNGALLLEEYKSVLSQRQTLEAQLEERRAEWASSQEIIRQYTATIPLVEQRLVAYESLFERKMATMNEYLALKEERFRQFHSLEAEKSRSVQLVLRS